MFIKKNGENIRNLSHINNIQTFFRRPRRTLALIVISCSSVLGTVNQGHSKTYELPSSQRAQKAIASVTPPLKKQLKQNNLSFGSPVFIRIFKQQRELEVWLDAADGEFKRFKTYRICNYSGHLGPKLKQGDRQSPEGFYFVKPQQLNPWSRFHLSFNLGYPNRYDRHHGRTGSALMVHGDCVSIGCYAMTDEGIEEIYTLINAALRGGQPFFRVHIFPFPLEDEKLAQHKRNPWFSFWQNLKEGYDYFEQYKRPPNIEVIGGRYSVTSKSDELWQR